jgi:nicotinate-nucleotide adenylyltransferase
MAGSRIGIMGGTFDPIHMGHLIIAELAKEAGGFDEIWFMPSYQPPHKTPLRSASAEERARMVEEAIRGNPSFRLERLEIERGGVSYTVDTVKELNRLYPEHRFSWIIGGDMVEYLPYWHRLDEIVQHARFFGVARPGFRIDPKKLPNCLEGKITIADMPEFDISSTQIRNRIADGQSIRYLVPDAVRAYITENRLYEL